MCVCVVGRVWGIDRCEEAAKRVKENGRGKERDRWEGERRGAESNSEIEQFDIIA